MIRSNNDAMDYLMFLHERGTLGREALTAANIMKEARSIARNHIFNYAKRMADEHPEDFIVWKTMKRLTEGGD